MAFCCCIDSELSTLPLIRIAALFSAHWKMCVCVRASVRARVHACMYARPAGPAPWEVCYVGSGLKASRLYKHTAEQNSLSPGFKFQEFMAVRYAAKSGDVTRHFNLSLGNLPGFGNRQVMCKKIFSEVHIVPSHLPHLFFCESSSLTSAYLMIRVN